MSGIPAGAGSLLGKRLGKYEILALLALGGTAEIYLARIGGTNGFERYVVVKCLHDHLADDQEFVKMFLDEARLAAMLDHSNIVQTFELGEHENRYYMVMEFLAGLSLAMIVRRAGERLANGTIPVPLILNAAAQACAGLHYAHERTANGKPLNMVHRDISPQNLVISFEGLVKVVDFGIARAELRETKTKAGTIKGKFAYMSPEQCVANNIDRRTDVFALGVIVHELLTGRRLFKRSSPYETYQAVIECEVPRPSTVNVELDPALDDVVMKALAKEKEHRYPTAEAFGDAMLGYLHHRGKASGPAELGRFIDQHFGQEIEEHADRMRELISHREFASVDTGVGWDDEEEKKALETVDLGGAESLHTADLELMRPSDASLQEVVSGLGDGDDEAAGDESDMPAERTRIEANPLDRIKELDAQAAKQAAQQAAQQAARTPAAGARIPSVRKTQTGATPVPQGSVTGGPAPLPAPPTVALTGAKSNARAATQSGPGAPGAAPAQAQAAAAAAQAAAQAAGVAGEKLGIKVPSGKFPDLANLPTMIADSDTPPPAPSPGPKIKTGKTPPPELAKTVLGAQPIGHAQQPIDLAQTMAELPPHAGAHGPAGHAPGGPLQTGPQMQVPGGNGDPHELAMRPTQTQDAVMPPSGGPHPGPGGPHPGPGGHPSGGPAAGPSSEQRPVQAGTPSGGSPYPVVSGGRPYNSDLAPSTLPSPQRSSYAGMDAPHAAALMSPVGPEYPQSVDWDAAAARPAKALPPWMLAALFVGALGVALLVTIVIAKIFH